MLRGVSQYLRVAKAQVLMLLSHLVSARADSRSAADQIQGNRVQGMTLSCL